MAPGSEGRGQPADVAAGLERDLVTVIEGRRPRTWLEATTAGRAALAAELAGLRELIDQVEGATTLSVAPPPRARPA